MKFLINILLIISCLWLAFEDFKSREISLWLVITTGVFLILSFFLSDGIKIISQIAMNVLFVIFLFLLLFYQSRRKGIHVFDMVGEGDWLMLLLFTLSFTTLGFTSFIMTGYITALAFTFLFKLYRNKESKGIPLAGILCIAFVFQLSIKFFIHEQSTLLEQLLVR